ncbi:MAG: CPBP family intramembrane metalloprotease [Bacteroidaceae bacterium]|nr:CPBP family intramembrane metalloprotease [Bacteroidaceae bacterium]
MKNVFKQAGYILLLLLAYLAFQVFFTFVAVMAAIFYADAKGYISIASFEQVLDYGDLMSSPAMSDISVWTVSIGLFVSSVAMLLFLYCIKGYRLRLSIFKSMPLKSLFLSTMLVLSSMFALNIFVQWLGLDDNMEVLFGDIVHNILGVITISLIAPLLEEVLFRGAIQGYMMRRYNPWTAIVCAALIFGVTHMNPVQIVYAALIGVIFGWIYYRTGSLLSVIVGHVLNNSMAAVTLLFFPESNALPVPEGVIPPEAQIVSEVMTFLFFAALSVYFAVKLHRAQPPVPSPWRDVTEGV